MHRAAVLALALAAAVHAQAPAAPKTHRLEATPQTVAYGYYWSEAKPVLRDRLGRHHRRRHAADQHAERGSSGPGSSRRTSSRRSARSSTAVTDKGPGGHILTGPVFVEGAEPGDALEVKILSIDLPIAYGYNGCSGFLRDNCKRARRR